LALHEIIFKELMNKKINFIDYVFLFRSSPFSARGKRGGGGVRRLTDGFGWISGIPYSFAVDLLFCGSS